MNLIEEENWEFLKHKMDDEGFHYCFDGYSNWKEIEDEKFHQLRENYLKSAKELKEYIIKKSNPFKLNHTEKGE